MMDLKLKTPVRSQVKARYVVTRPSNMLPRGNKMSYYNLQSLTHSDVYISIRRTILTNQGMTAQVSEIWSVTVACTSVPDM